MREIKFRAKELSNSQWVYGFYTQGEYFNPNTNEATIRHLIQADVLHDIDPNTLGQYSGLHDKDGVEIYEGDIVEMMRTPEKRKKKVMTRHIVTVESVRDWYFKSLIHEVIDFSMGNQSDKWSSYRYKVIGNIHDNPDLVQEISLNLPKHKTRKQKDEVTVELVFGNSKVSTNVPQNIAEAFIKELDK